ncbi:hypothetical protein M0802_003077 [Mischocyttarus mexicanus]|nr:hypothetical protein M0802_003077 [Mischocyttarus mexicanus]
MKVLAQPPRLDVPDLYRWVLDSYVGTVLVGCINSMENNEHLGTGVKTIPVFASVYLKREILQERQDRLVGEEGGRRLGRRRRRCFKSFCPLQATGEEETESTRKSLDKTVNREEVKLLKFCEEAGGMVKNGATKGDRIGNWTFVGGGAQSVLDLVIELEKAEGSVVDDIEVLPRIESDHLPYGYGKKIVFYYVTDLVASCKADILLLSMSVQTSKEKKRTKFEVDRLDKCVKGRKIKWGMKKLLMIDKVRTR